MGLDKLFGALAKEALDLLKDKAGIDLPVPGGGERAPAAVPAGSGPPPAGPVPYGLDRRPLPPGESVDALLPPQVGDFARTRVNDRFGGPRAGGVFGAYAGHGGYVSVLASVAPSAAVARSRVAEFRAGEREAGVAPPAAESLGTEPSYSGALGAFIWSRGPYVFSASTRGTEGDVALPATPEEVAVLERFMAAFPY